MIKHIFLLTLAFTFSAFADSNDFGRSNRGTPLSPQEIRERLEVTGEIFVSSPDGERLSYQANELRSWRFGDQSKEIRSNWSYEHDDGSVRMALKHTWTVDDQGKIKVHFEQFDRLIGADPQSADDKVTYGKKIRDEVITVKDFSSITWLVESSPRQRVVARFTPALKSLYKFADPSNQPLVIENGILTDSKNRVWAEDLSGISHKYVSLRTHLGTVVMSFYPFKNAEQIGYAEGNEILIKQNGLGLKIRSAKPVVLANRRLRVYGRIDLSKKSKNYGSVHMKLGDDDKDLPDFATD